MPDERYESHHKTAVEAIWAHIDLWNAGDHDKWSRLFAEEVLFVDPRIQAMRGRAALVERWMSPSAGSHLRLDPLYVLASGPQLAACLIYMTGGDDAHQSVPTIELWGIDEAGRVNAVTVFVA